MEPELNQDPMGQENMPSMEDMSPDEAAASLAFATQLSEGMMTPAEMPMGEPVEGQEEEMMAEGELEPEIEKENGKDEIVEVKESFNKQIEGLREEWKAGREKDMAEIRTIIKDFLKD